MNFRDMQLLETLKHVKKASRRELSRQGRALGQFKELSSEKVSHSSELNLNRGGR